ncbi:S1 family peptidase [Actinokineospora sp.]|uniref:S1 family peptidase n=1 Tax=Actinokineospora sp. TaxID=1872133 RepID=UPI003D6BF62C
MSRRTLSSALPLICAAVTAAALATPASAAPASVLDASASPSTLAATEQSLRDQLGGAYAHSWLDTTTGKFVVGVTDATRASEVRESGAQAKVVARSATALEHVQSTLDQRARTAPDSVTGWYVDAPANEVVVWPGAAFRPLNGTGPA